MVRWRAFGIPVFLDAWFLVVPVFVFAWAGGGRSGVFGALAVVVFALVHEGGHAVAARRVGLPVAIELNGLRGWSGPDDGPPLSRRSRIAVGLAGPLVEIAVVVPILAVIHLEMQRRLGTTDTAGALLTLDLWTGVVSAGLMLALLTLLPLWPLDGGHVLAHLLPGRRDRVRRGLAIATVYVCGALVLLNIVARASHASGLLAEERRALAAPLRVLDASFASALWEQVRAFPGRLLFASWFLLLFCALPSWRARQRGAVSDASWIDVPPRPRGQPERRGRERTGNDRADFLERSGWEGGPPGAFPTGWGPSPWLRAERARRDGDTEGARAALATVTEAGGRRWIPPDAERSDLAALVPLLPDPLPLGAPIRSLLLLAVLAVHAEPARTLEYARRLYEHTHDAEALYLAAEGLARHGCGDDAMVWLRRALLERPDPGRLTRARALSSLHERLDFQQLVATMRAART